MSTIFELIAAINQLDADISILEDEMTRCTQRWIAERRRLTESTDKNESTNIGEFETPEFASDELLLINRQLSDIIVSINSKRELVKLKKSQLLEQRMASELDTPPLVHSVVRRVAPQIPITPLPSEELQNLANQLYKRPSWHYLIFGFGAFAVGQILSLLFPPAQLATIDSTEFLLNYILASLVLYPILGWVSSPYKHDLRAILVSTGLFIFGFGAQAGRQVNLFQEAQTASAFAATQNAPPTSTSTSTLTPRPTPTPTTPTPTITHTPTATLLPEVYTATAVSLHATVEQVNYEYKLKFTQEALALQKATAYSVTATPPLVKVANTRVAPTALPVAMPTDIPTAVAAAAPSPAPLSARETVLATLLANAVSHWPNDPSMVQLEYNEQVAAYDWVIAQTAYPDIMAAVKQAWGDDYAMMQADYDLRVFDVSTGAAAAAPSSAAAAGGTKPSSFIGLAFHVFNGVKVYYGYDKAYGFEVIGATGSGDCPIAPSGQGLFVKYPNGTQEWKDYDAMVYSGNYYIGANDPNRSGPKLSGYNSCW